MQNQQVMGILTVTFRRKFKQLLLNLQHGFTGAESGSVGNPKDVCVHCDCGFSKCGIQDDICGFTTDARKSFERLSVRRDLSVVQIDQHAAGLHDVLCFCVIQPNCSNVAFKAG